MDSAETFAENNGLDLPVIAVENGGGIAQTMPMGEVTRGDILDAFNHGNLVVALSVTPAQLYEALEVGLTMTGQDDTGLLVRERVSGSFLQASGFTYTYDPSGEAGAKVTQVVLSDGKTLTRDDAETKLLLATNNYTATFAGLKDGEQLGELGGEDLIVEEYLLAQTKNGTEPLDYPMSQGRIQIANDTSPAQYAVAIPVLSQADSSSPLPAMTVHLKVDGGEYQEMTTDADGMLKVDGLAKGPHQFFLQEAAGQAVYVNNYSGSGTVTTKDGYYRLGFLVDAAPAGPVARAMAVSALWELAGSPEASASSFLDVAANASYAGAANWAASTGVVKGYPGGLFQPDTAITREQLAVILYRYEQTKGGGFTGDWMFRLDYTDAAEVSEWAYEAVCWCTMNQLLTGTGGALEPAGQISQAELTEMLTLYQNLGE